MAKQRVTPRGSVVELAHSLEGENPNADIVLEISESHLIDPPCLRSMWDETDLDNSIKHDLFKLEELSDVVHELNGMLLIDERARWDVVNHGVQYRGFSDVQRMALLRAQRLLFERVQDTLERVRDRHTKQS